MNIRTRTRRTAVAMVAALTGSLLLAAPAAAAPSEASYVGPGAGYANITIDPSADSGSRDAGFFRFEIEGGDEVRALCIQYAVTLNTSGDFVSVDRSSTPVSNEAIGRAVWIGKNHTSVGTPLDDANMEAVAAAMAAWTFTDGKEWTEDNMLYPDARERAAELRSAAQSATPAAAGPTSFNLTVDADRTGDGQDVTADISLTTDDGTPLAGEEIVITFSDGTSETVTTDSDGQAAATAEDIEEAGVVSAAWAGNLPAGTVLDSQDGGQLVVTLDDARITRTGEAEFSSAPAPVAETPVTDPEPAPEPVADEDPEPVVEAPEETEEPETVVESAPEPEATSTRQELPYTGPGLFIPLGLALGGGAAWVGRRMRKQADDTLGG